jgi:hypothetical protein
MENKTEIMQHILKMQCIYLFLKYIKLILGLGGGGLYVCSYKLTQVFQRLKNM